jgi:hypothetical protein
MHLPYFVDEFTQQIFNTFMFVWNYYVETFLCCGNNTVLDLDFTEGVIWGLIKNIQDRIYCTKLKLFQSYSEVSPSR